MSGRRVETHLNQSGDVVQDVEVVLPGVTLGEIPTWCVRDGMR